MSRMTDPAKLRQHVRYAATADGARLAWAESGSGAVVVKAANWLTHLEYEWESPVLEALAAVLLGEQPVRALRRTRLRDE